MQNVLSPGNIARNLQDLWSPRIIAGVNDVYVKVARLHGTLAWHRHEHEDELFFVLKGRLDIEMEDGVVVLHEGDMYVVPRNVRHNPVAKEECHVLLVESKSTLHTGDVKTPKTRSVEEQFG